MQFPFSQKEKNVNYKGIFTTACTHTSLTSSAGLKIKKILRLPFGNQLEKYSNQMQIFTRQFV